MVLKGCSEGSWTAGFHTRRALNPEVGQEWQKGLRHQMQVVADYVYYSVTIRPVLFLEMKKQGLDSLCLLPMVMQVISGRADLSSLIESLCSWPPCCTTPALTT